MAGAAFPPLVLRQVAVARTLSDGRQDEDGPEEGGSVAQVMTTTRSGLSVPRDAVVEAARDDRVGPLEIGTLRDTCVAQSAVARSGQGIWHSRFLCAVRPPRMWMRVGSEHGGWLSCPPPRILGLVAVSE